MTDTTAMEGKFRSNLYGVEAASLCVRLCRAGLFPAIGCEPDGSGYVLGPFYLADMTCITGCASIHWNDERQDYAWTAYLDIGGTEVRGCWPTTIIPDEVKTAILKAHRASL